MSGPEQEVGAYRVAVHAVPSTAGLGRLGEALAQLAAEESSVEPQVVRSPAAGGPGGSLRSGEEAADLLVDAGVRLLVVDGTTGAAHAPLVLLAALLGLEPVVAVGTEPGEAWTERILAVRAGLPAARGLAGDPAALLEAVGDPGTAHLAGLLARSASRRTPALLDGTPDVVAAALLAERLRPGSSPWWLACSQPALPAARRALDELSLPPLLDLGLTRPGGATFALALLRAAAASRD